MAYLYTIQLEQLKFYAYHGVYKKEKEVGNSFLVDVAITLKTEQPIKTLSQTIDYTAVAQITEKIMTDKHTDLLETLAYEIMENIHIKFSFLPIQKIWIKISKVNPPLRQICQQSSVCIEKYYEHP